MEGIRIRSFRAGQALQWLSCGWRLSRRRLPEAVAPAAAFVLLALTLRFIPVLGDVLLLLILPTVVTSYLIHADVLARTSGAPRARIAKGSPKLERWLRELRVALFGAWSNAQNVFPLILAGLILVIFGLIALALFTAVGGQAVVSPYGFFELTGMQMVRLLLAYAATVLFWVAVTMLLLWTLPLFAIRDIALVGALGLNLKAMLRNGAAVGVFLLLLAVALLPAALVRPYSAAGALLVLWLCATAAAVAFGFGGYCSFRLVFADAEPRQS